MSRILAKKKNSEQGQAILLVVVAMGVFLVGALGLAIDGASLYGHRSMAQAAADAAAQAGILSMFNGTNVGTNLFADTTAYTHTCTTSDVLTPCRHARRNGFGLTASDVVFIDIPSTAASIGLDPASLTATPDPVKMLRVTITRHVGSSLTRMVGAANTVDVTAVAVAAIVGVESAVPILVTHPTLSGALSGNGNTLITICGGPSKSIQVNSSSATAYGGGSVDLSHAGPADSGTCSTGTGADLGVLGGPTTKPSGVSLGTTGTYISPASRIQDPLANITAPAAPVTVGAFTSIANGVDGCADSGGCREYSPGLYVGGINAKNVSVIFKPGLYYMRGGGFTMKGAVGGGGAANNYNAMCTTCAADTDTGTGMVVYDTGNCGATPCVYSANSSTDNSGSFQIDTNVQATLRGATKTTTNSSGNTVPAAPYYGILFWEDRNSDATSHGLGQGNGCFSLVGTIYITNRMADMLATPAHYQSVSYNGNPCSTTIQQGNIIVSALSMVGSSQLTMNLVPYGFLVVRQTALVR